MKFNNLILEISKKDVLVTKLKFTPESADELVKICGPLSVWMANKLIKHWYPEFGTPGNTWTIDQIGQHMGSSIRNLRQQLIGIMDWVRVGLDGNITPHKDLSIKELIDKSAEWHDSLGAGEGDIDYVEDNIILLDFRKDGIGFYWTDLDTNASDEECNRMGHCGRTSYSNKIISLRENKRIGPKHTKNVSHLTAAIGDGIIYQLKGQKNSKPKEEFYKYIIPLIMSDYVTGFGSEYNSANDFKISDLPENEIKSIYKQKPTLFSRYSDKRMLWRLGIIEKPKMVFTLTDTADRVDRYVDGDYSVRSWTDKKTGIKHKIGLFETILSGDIWDIYDSNGYDGDWEQALTYHADDNSKKRIWGLVKKNAIENDIELDPELSLEEAIKEVDSDDEIATAIRRALNDEEADSYYTMVHKKLKDCLETFGEVVKMDDTGIEIKVNLDSLIGDIEDDVFDDYMERCDNTKEQYECMFTEMLGEHIDKPTFDVDDRWYPDVDNKSFNERLQEALNEI